MPRFDEMMALLYAHPIVYIDVAGLQSPAITPRAGYLWYLQRLIESGFAGRIMFGSGFADQVESGIQTIVDAPFLSAEQKADILRGSIPAPCGIGLRTMSWNGFEMAEEPIASDPKILGGEPCVSGTRLSVEFVSN